MERLTSLLAAAALVAVLASRRRPPRLRAERFPGPVRGVLALALLALVLAAVAIEPLWAFVSPAPDAGLPGGAEPQPWSAHAVLGGFLAAWWMLAGREPPGRFLMLPAAPLPRRLLRGLCAGIVSWFATIAVTAAVAGAAYLLGGLSIEGAAPPSTVVAAALPEPIGRVVALPLLDRVALVLGAGLVEEAFFRSFLQPRCGLLVSSLLFTSSHAGYGSPLMLVGVFTLSAILGLLLHRDRDALPCMVGHAVFDAIQLLVVLPVIAAAG